MYRADDKNCGVRIAVGFSDIMVEVAGKEAQKDESYVYYAPLWIDAFLRMPNGEESKTVCSRFALLSEEVTYMLTKRQRLQT